MQGGKGTEDRKTKPGLEKTVIKVVAAEAFLTCTHVTRCKSHPRRGRMCPQHRCGGAADTSITRGPPSAYAVPFHLAKLPSPGVLFFVTARVREHLDMLSLSKLSQKDSKDGSSSLMNL